MTHEPTADDLQRLHQALRRSQSQLDLVADSGPVALWSRNLDTGELTWSDSMRRMFAVPRDVPVTLETVFERVHPDDAARVDAALAADPRDGAPDDPLEFRIVLPDGETRWISVQGRLDTGDPTPYRHGVALDVTRYKRAELRAEAAREEAERAHAQLAFLADAGRILSSSLDFRVTLTRVARLAVPRLADWCAVDLLDGTGTLERVAVEHQDPTKTAWAHDLQRRYPPSPTATNGVYQVVRTGRPSFYPVVTDAMLVAGARDAGHLEAMREVGFSSLITVPLVSRERAFGTLTLVYAESGRRYGESDLELGRLLALRAAVAVDNARLYHDAQRVNEELERRVVDRTRELREVNEELEAFTFGASHDLRAPLRGIDGFSKLLAEEHGADLDEDARRHLGRIRSGAQRMGEIIDALLALSRLSRTALEPVEVDLAALAGEIVTGLREREAGRRVTVRVAPGLTGWGDPGLLRVVLHDLLDNAWKFTRERADANVEVVEEMRSDGRWIVVRDDGAGFDMRYAEKLFVPFGRLHREDEFEGLGVGLARVQRIVRRHGGRVWASGAPGDGAAVGFTLPPRPARVD